MPRNKPEVHVSVTFVPAKNGKNPSISILDPIDLTHSIGTFYCNEFSKLKLALSEVVADEAYDLWFHRDKNNIYSFDESAFQGVAIYARKQKKKEGENDKTKVTASKLASITNAKEFEKHVKEVSDAVYKRSSKTSSKSKKGKQTSKR